MGRRPLDLGFRPLHVGSTPLKFRIEQAEQSRALSLPPSPPPKGGIQYLPMPVCGKCGGHASRAPRTAWEKLVYRSCYECTNCQKRMCKHRPWALQFSIQAHCPRCGTDQLKPRITRDRIDALLWSPARLVHRLLGGHLYHCHACRLQFYDLRNVNMNHKPNLTPPL
jgi:hypothetical protein